MKIKFKHQPFQQDASNSICDVFIGQPKIKRHKYTLDVGENTKAQVGITDHKMNTTGYNNAKFEIDNTQILQNIQTVQLASNNIKPSTGLEVNKVKIEVDDSKSNDDSKTNKKKKSKKTVNINYNFSVEMETGTGKTYTYIKTMYDLNEKYGWTKFIIIVPSVAIREGIYNSLESTKSHFSEVYGKKIRYFVYNSSQLNKIDDFASDSGINVMIINSQAFNSTGKDARRIYQKLDSFRSRRPIDILASTNPILIIDEPQSVEGEKTKARLTEFNPLFTLRYSATHKDQYNMLYRLDALDAYNKKLVKKISAKCISIAGSTGTEGYLYLQQIITSQNKLPDALLEFEVNGKKGVQKISRKLSVKDNIYELSNELEEYKGYVISEINALTDSVTFTNGVIIHTAEVKGQVNEEQIRRLQIRETIRSHIEKEKDLFYKDIKVISLFFIDEVAKYRVYDDKNNYSLGEYAQMFEEEYEDLLGEYQTELDENDGYYDYLFNIKANRTHKGYFSIDKNKKTNAVKFVDSKIADKKANLSDDVDAYNLIMKDKERLLAFKEHTRFIFSHSALREGWDNPNVFQICTLKKLSDSDIRSRQEIGRGLRLSVDQDGNRQDESVLGRDVHKLNKLTVITESNFEEYVKLLQKGIAETIKERAKEVTQTLFENKLFKNSVGEEIVVDKELAIKIHENLVKNDYIENGKTTEKYIQALATYTFVLSEELQEYSEQIIGIIDTIYDETDYNIENENNTPVTAKVNEINFAKKEFKELWSKINKKSAYTVSFKDKELIKNSITELNAHLRVLKIYFNVVEGEMEKIESKDELLQGNSFKVSNNAEPKNVLVTANTSVKYDLIGKIVNQTELTRKTVGAILKGLKKGVFNQFQQNPEDFINKAATLINEQKATIIIEHITYNVLTDEYKEDIFTKAELKGKLNVNALETSQKNIFDHLIYDSQTELKMGEKLEITDDVCVYVKLPNQFYINTPVGKYNPDWAIAFNQDNVKHVYFVAETKGSMSTMQLRKMEQIKIDCATKHFKEISNDEVKYGVVTTYDELLDLVK